LPADPWMTQKLWSRTLLTLTVTLVLLLNAGRRDAHAQTQAPVPTDNTIDTQLFEQAIGPHNFITVDAPDVARHKQLGFGLMLNYQLRPYVIYTQGTDGQGSTVIINAHVVEHQVTTELAASIALFSRVQLGLALPFTPILTGDAVDAMGRPTGQTQNATGLGDLRVEAKAQLGTLGDDDQFTLGLLAGVSIPTAKLAGASLDVPTANGSSGGPYYLGDKSFTGRIKALAGLEVGRLRGAANFGVLLRESSQSYAAVVGNQLLYGGAAAYELRKRVELIVELSGRSGLSQFTSFYSDANPFEVDGALRLGITSMWAATLGFGRGIGKGIGAPAGRGFLGVSFTPDYRDRDHDGVYDADDKCPDDPEDRDGFQDADGCPDPDNDNDGILDAQDKCPNDPEDKDQFQDEDGCPDLDNDKDGIPDLNDACPNAAEDGRGKRPKDGCPSTSEDSDGDGINDTIDKCPDDPEDRDGFQDEDGCPDPDNDNDGIPDNFDNCPNQPEDADGFQDEDGCPDPDNDQDGIPDTADKCPNQPETLNLNKDEDGCPDPGTVIVRLGTGRIEVDERLSFSTRGGKSELKENSTKVVGLVALVMKGHPDIKKLRIEVKADGVSKEETQRRAELIRDVLVSRGVETARLAPLGLGGGGARVDFVIEAMAPAPAKPAAPPADAAGGQKPAEGGEPTTPEPEAPQP
jgi:OOP family OmpA-OmpF porin